MAVMARLGVNETPAGNHDAVRPTGSPALSPVAGTIQILHRREGALRLTVVRVREGKKAYATHTHPPTLHLPHVTASVIEHIVIGNVNVASPAHPNIFNVCKLIGFAFLAWNRIWASAADTPQGRSSPSASSPERLGCHYLYIYVRFPTAIEIASRVRIFRNKPTRGGALGGVFVM